MENNNDNRRVMLVSAIRHILERYNAHGNDNNIDKFSYNMSQSIEKEKNYDDNNKNRLELNEVFYAQRCIREFVRIVKENHLEDYTGKQILEEYGDRIIDPKFMQEEEEKIKEVKNHKDLKETLKEKENEER